MVRSIVCAIADACSHLAHQEQAKWMEVFQAIVSRMRKCMPQSTGESIDNVARFKLNDVDTWLGIGPNVPSLGCSGEPWRYSSGSSVVFKGSSSSWNELPNPMMAVVCVLIAIIKHAIAVGSTSTRISVFMEIAEQAREIELLVDITNGLSSQWVGICSWRLWFGLKLTFPSSCYIVTAIICTYMLDGYSSDICSAMSDRHLKSWWHHLSPTHLFWQLQTLPSTRQEQEEDFW